MNIEETIKSEITAARKKKDSKKLQMMQAVLAGVQEISTGVKGRTSGTTDDEAIAFFKNLTKKNLEQIGKLDDVRAERYVYENEFIGQFIPEVASMDEVKSVIIETIKVNEIQNMKGLGIIMKEIKSKFGTNVDNAEASRIARGLLG